MGLYETLEHIEILINMVKKCLHWICKFLEQYLILCPSLRIQHSLLFHLPSNSFKVFNKTGTNKINIYINMSFLVRSDY